MNRNNNLNFEKKTVYEIYRACRLCGASGGYKMPISQNVIDLEVSDVELKQKIQECVQIEVHSEDRMPPLICELCVDKVHNFYEFLQLCQQTNRRTRLRLGLPLQKVPVRTLVARESNLGSAPDSGDDEPLAKGKKTKVKVEKEVKAKVEEATPRESRPPARKDKPRSSRRDGGSSKSSHRSRSPSASFEESPREAPKRTTRNSEDAAFRAVREMDSPSPPPNKRATRNSYETDSAFRPSSKTERNTKTLPKEAVRPTRGVIKVNKTDEAPEFLKPSPKCHKTPAEPAPRTTKKPTETPAPKSKKPTETPAPKPKKPTETPAPKSKKPTETPAPKSKKPSETPAPKSKKPPELPAPKSKKPETAAPKSTKAPECTLPQSAKKRTETPPPKTSRKRPPENETQIPAPKKIKLPPAAPAPLFPCALCGVGFATAQALSNHMRHHVPNYTPVKLACNACALWFVTSEESSAHHRTHRGTNAYVCARCEQAYKMHAAFNDHLITCLPYTEVPDLKCEACWRLFPTERLMAQHRCLGEDNRPGGPCSKCSRSYALLKNLSKHESTCQHRKKGDAIVDPEVLARIRPIQVRVAKCDPLLKMAAGGSHDVSRVVGKYGLDKTCFYPYGLHIKREPDGMVSITDELLDFVHWDSDCTDSSDDSAEASAKREAPENLSTLTLKVLFSKKCIGKVPRKVRKKLVKDEDAFDADVDRDIKNDISNVNDNLSSWNDNVDIFSIRGRTVEASDDLDLDNIFDSLQNHDKDVRDDPKSSDSNEVSILKAVGYETPVDANADKRDLLDKELKSSTLVSNGLEGMELDGSVEERLEEVKELADLDTENCLGKVDKDLGIAAVPEEILDRVEEDSDSAVTENLEKVDKDLGIPVVPNERLDGMDKKLEIPTIFDGRLGAVEEKFEKPPINVKEIGQTDVNLECPTNADRTLGEMDKDLASSSVTGQLEGQDKDLKTRNEEVVQSMNDIDRTVESRPTLSRTTDESEFNTSSHPFRDDGSSVAEKYLESGDKILEDKSLEKSPDKSFTQFCINNIITSITNCGSNGRNNLNTDTTEAVNSNIQTDLDGNLDVSKETDCAMKENDNTTSNNLCPENEDLDVSAKQNGITTDDNSEKQLLDALDKQFNETFGQCHMLGVNTTVIDRNDVNSKPEDSRKIVDSKTNNSDMKSMDLDNISDEEFDFDS